MQTPHGANMLIEQSYANFYQFQQMRRILHWLIALLRSDEKYFVLDFNELMNMKVISESEPDVGTW